MGRLISLYDVTDPFILHFLLLPVAGALTLLGVLWIFVHNRSKRAKRIAVLVSAASPGVVGLTELLLNGRLGIGAWLRDMGQGVLVMLAGYYILFQIDAFAEASRERQAGPLGATPEQQRKAVRRAVAILVVGFSLIIVIALWNAVRTAG